MINLFCCGNCFNDKLLTQFILTGGETQSICSFCGKENAVCIEPSKLTHLFLPFMELYETSPGSQGKRLWDLLKKDWLLFDSLSPEVCERLLSIILPDENISKKYYLERESASADEQISKWTKFKNELKHVNRYFYYNSPEQEPLVDMFSFLTQIVEPPRPFFRARISYDSKLFRIDAMGKPPADKVGNGRANPIGISYLYTASDKETAIAELRPHVGDSVCVCEFKTTEKLKFVDLRNPRKTISPFDVVQREGKLEDAIDRLEYLNKLGQELSKPVIPRDANLEYLSSQYLCELIKYLKYDGVVYKSSVGGGDNYAIFVDKGITGENITMFKIMRNLYKTELIEA